MTDSPNPNSAPIPVLCDQCRATGLAGDAFFSAIPDILAFDPVPRRAHVNNWTPEHQRAFIAALAITGSPRQAARVLGRHMFGAQQLRTARGGKSFDAAWDAALEIARDREFAQIHANLATLSAEREAGDAAATAGASSYVPTHMVGRTVPRLDAVQAHAPNLYGETLDPDATEERRDAVVTRLHIREKLTRARRLLLMFLGEDPAKRAAWETLVGPVDWDRASRCESQADEPFADPQFEHYEGYDKNPHCMNKPGMLLTAEAGFLSDLTGGEDALAPLRAIVAGNDDGDSDDGDSDDGDSD